MGSDRVASGCGWPWTDDFLGFGILGVKAREVRQSRQLVTLFGNCQPKGTRLQKSDRQGSKMGSLPSTHALPSPRVLEVCGGPLSHRSWPSKGSCPSSQQGNLCGQGSLNRQEVESSDSGKVSAACGSAPEPRLRAQCLAPNFVFCFL